MIPKQGVDHVARTEDELEASRFSQQEARAVEDPVGNGYDLQVVQKQVRVAPSPEIAADERTDAGSKEGEDHGG